MSYLRQTLAIVTFFLCIDFAAAQQKQPVGAEANAGKERTIIFNLRQDSDQQMTCFLSNDTTYFFEITLPEESKAQRIVLKLYDGDMNEVASSSTVLKNNTKPSLKYASKKSGLYLLKAFPFAK
jgi:bisphosphoglycerate-independent phosphoglycerate mutase (AlkP superfamily)